VTAPAVDYHCANTIEKELSLIDYKEEGVEIDWAEIFDRGGGSPPAPTKEATPAVTPKKEITPKVK